MDEIAAKERFFKENPFASYASNADAKTSSTKFSDPVYLALMAIAFELWLNREPRRQRE
jgi:hypothetical protein